MGLKEKISKYGRIGVDTNLFIYAIEQHPEFWELAKSVLDLIEDGEAEAVASTISLTEILTKPVREGNYQLETDYRALFYHFPNLQVVPVDIPVAERASFIRAKHGIRTPDALIIASVIEAGAKLFISNDEQLKKITDIQVLGFNELM